MESIFSNDAPFIHWVIIPILIVLARILDVSMGTIRIILLGKGYRLGAAMLGFIEVFIWIMVIGQILQNLDNILYYIAYAAGFASGTYIGMVIENKLSIGKVVVRVITKLEAHGLLDFLLGKEYNMTVVDAEGRFGRVKIIFMVMERRDVDMVIQNINKFNPNAFYTIEDVRFVNKLYPIEAAGHSFSRRFHLRDLMFKRK